ncbi:MAG: M28 family metallopeptidase [Flavobacteriales bacterium]
MRLALSICSLFFAAGFVFSQTYPYQKAIEELCSPAYAGRGYVNQGSQKAATFIAQEFKRIGLQTLGKNSYQQYFSFPVQTFPGACQIIVGDDTLQPGKDYIVDAASAGIQTPKQYQLVYCNTKSLYRSVNAFKPCPPDRMLVIQTSGFGGDTNKVLQTRLQELKSFAATIELSDKKLTWSVSQTVSPYPAFQMQLAALSALPSSALIHLESVYETKFSASNVIGYLPAAQKASKKPYIVLTAHYDHLGQMGKDTYFPGANDNASGVGMLLHLANELKKQRNPNFNYVFIAFGGEEAGLVGSAYFVGHPLIPLKNIRFLLNTDIMGSGEEGITVVNATLFTVEFERLKELNRESNFLTQIKSRGPAANSDHYFFTEKGVPAFFVYTMGPNKNYHDVYDRYEALSFAAFEPLAKLLYQFLNSF